MSLNIHPDEEFNNKILNSIGDIPSESEEITGGLSQDELLKELNHKLMCGETLGGPLCDEIMVKIKTPMYSNIECDKLSFEQSKDFPNKF